MHSMKSRALRLVLALAALPLAAGAARATDINLASWISAVKVSGDFRLRQEDFHFRQNAIDRSRQRYRLRLGLELPLSDTLTLKTRLATGEGGQQVSTNQSFRNLSSEDSFWVDRAYLEWKPVSMFKLTGGKMAMPLWVQYTSDIVWDDDFNPEGLAENLESPAYGPVKFFANGMQMVDSEDAKTNRDQFTFTEQLGAEVQLPFEMRLKVGYANHNWVNVSTTGVTGGSNPINAQTPIDANGNSSFPATDSFGQATTQNGNRRYASGVLADHFRVDEWTLQLSAWVFRIPVSLQGTYIRNNGALEQFTPKYNTGFQHGIIIGKAAAKNTWEAAYFVKNVGTDATVADVADSDFGNGGTNRKGRIYWVAFNPQDYLQFKVKFFTTSVRDTNIPTVGGASTAPNAPNDINRLQVDASVKF